MNEMLVYMSVPCCFLSRHLVRSVLSLEGRGGWLERMVPVHIMSEFLKTTSYAHMSEERFLENNGISI